MGDRLWRPVLIGADAAEAIAIVHAIAEELPEHRPPSASAPPSLIEGTAGIALFYAYLASVTGKERHADLAEAYAEAALDAIAGLDEDDANDPWGPRSFANGIAGVGWAMEHLRGRLWDPSEDPNEATDAIVDGILANGTRALPRYELLFGLVGHGVYALERFAHGGKQALCEAVLAGLEARARRVPSGVTWLTPPQLVVERDRALATSEGLYDLGVAHGVPGVLAQLANLHGVPALRPRVEPMMSGAASWLCGQRLEEGSVARFPYAVGAGSAAERATRPPRAAWCYGDPAIALTLLRTANALGDDQLAKEALGLARSVAARGEAECGIEDAGLCHGAAGLALVLQRLAHAAPNEGMLFSAAQRWARTALRMRKPDLGVGGYAALDVTPDGTRRWHASTGLLTGAAGVGLGLLALATDQEPCWDRCLLLSGLSESEAA